MFSANGNKKIDSIKKPINTPKGMRVLISTEFFESVGKLLKQ